MQAERSRAATNENAGGYRVVTANDREAPPAIAWANPMLKLPQLAKMSGKSLTWLQEQMRSRDHFPYYRPGGPTSHPVVLWSEYVDWLRRKFGEEGER